VITVTEYQEQLAGIAKARGEAGDTPAIPRLAEEGAHAGPGEGLEPGELGPSAVDRNYISEGHASESPMAALPRTNPLPMLRPGYPQSIALSPQVRAAQIPDHVVAACSMVSPSEK
jgi:hypothetical protein